MKKTLVALAVLAASGASFAQATITGNYTFGYKQSQDAGAASVSGFGTDTAAIKVAASEDLGGGLTAAAQVTLGGMMRDGAGTGEDAFLTLTGGFGALKLGTVEIPNGLLAIGSSGASGFGLDGAVLAANANGDVVGYSMPLTSSLTLGVTYVDRGAAATASAAAGTSGLGTGTSGSAGGQPSFTAGLTYAAGALTAKIDTTSWNRNGDADVTNATGTPLSANSANVNQNRYRLSGAYDLGAARLSAGYSRATASGDTVATETLLGVAVPMGATTFGLDYGMSDANTAGSKTSEKSGYSVGVSYALSKRTSVSASYRSWHNAKATAPYDGNNTGFRTYVSHSF